MSEGGRETNHNSIPSRIKNQEISRDLFGRGSKTKTNTHTHTHNSLKLNYVGCL